jgi:predicted ATPase/class 3 adenylate cyclase/Tfp pilus assembly protein PilF
MTESAALLYTDLVDSTRLGEQIGEAAMLQLWQSHDRAARDLVRDWHGIEIGRSDGFLLMFTTVDLALAFAAAYHGMLQTLHPALQTRVGLHVGPVRLRVNSAADTELGATRYDLDGGALPVVARVMSAAIAGQTLVTADALLALGSDAAPLRSHGHWRLKGVAEPLELFEAPHPGAPMAPPPDSSKVYRVVRQGEAWLPRREIAHNLPAERDAFVGRGDVLQQLAQRFDDGARLVTLLGTGGAGKTRTALRFGRTWLGDFPGGVSFCDLSQARSLDDVVRAVAQGMDVPLGAQDAVQQLARALAGRSEALVILDNLEQVTALMPQTLGIWLDRTTQVRFLATTRAVLGLAGEQVLNLAPLPAPDGTALFVLRAEAAASNFSAGAAEEVAINALVRLLDGLPLAIELAAARARLLSPQALLQRMGDRFRLLAVGGGRSDRQATLRGALDWSWDLLTPAEKSALAQLSVFEGGFTLAAAEAVLVLPPGDDSWSVDVVQSLVDKSLVRSGQAGRLDLLQSVQVYAAENLATVGRFEGSGAEFTTAAQTRHAVYFARLGEATPVMRGGIELANFVAACRRSVDRREAAAAAGALHAAWAILALSGPFTAAAALASEVASIPGLQPAELAIADGVLGSALCQLGRVQEAEPRLLSALNSALKAGLPQLEIHWLCAAAEMYISTGRLDDATAALERARRLALDDPGAKAMHVILNGCGSVAIARGALGEARTHFELAVTLARTNGDERWIGGLLSNLGVIAYGEGRLDDSRELLTQALTLASSVGDRRWQGSARCNLALLLHEQGHHVQAREQFEATLVLARSVGHARLEATVLCNLGLVLEALDELDTARQRLQAAVAVAHELRDGRSEGSFLGYLGRICARIGHREEALAALDAGERLLHDGADGLTLGLLLTCRAQATCVLGDAVAANAALQAAQTLCDANGAGMQSELGAAIRNVGALLLPP